MKILVINSGSSSIKYSFFDVSERKALATGLVEKIGEAGSRIRHTVFTSEPATEVVRGFSVRNLLDLRELASSSRRQK